MKAKTLELEQVSATCQNLRWLKEEMEAKSCSRQKEQEGIIQQLQTCLHDRNKEVEVRPWLRLPSLQLVCLQRERSQATASWLPASGEHLNLCPCLGSWLLSALLNPCPCLDTASSRLKSFSSPKQVTACWWRCLSISPSLSCCSGAHSNSALQAGPRAERGGRGAVRASPAQGKNAAGPPQRQEPPGDGARCRDPGAAAGHEHQGAVEQSEFCTALWCGWLCFVFSKQKLLSGCCWRCLAGAAEYLRATKVLLDQSQQPTWEQL